MPRFLVPILLAGGAMSVAGLVSAQQSPVIDLAGPDGPVVTAPPDETTDPIGEVLEEAPPESELAPSAPDPTLAARENRASLEIAAEAAEEIPPEELEPPPPPPPPMKRPRYTAAKMVVVDKISAETLRFDLKVGMPVRYKSLVFNLRACETTAPDETVRDEIAYLEVTAAPLPVANRPTPPARDVYKGWAFASSPALHPIEHPLYDAWLVECAGKPPTPLAGDRPTRPVRRRRPRTEEPAQAPGGSPPPVVASGEPTAPSASAPSTADGRR